MADITALDFPEVTDILTDDILYLIRGTGVDRDKKIQAGLIIPTVLSVTDTAAIDLSTYKGDLVIVANKASAFTITFSNYLVSGRKLIIIGKGAGIVTFAGTLIDDVQEGYTRSYISDGTDFYNTVKPKATDLYNGEIFSGATNQDDIFRALEDFIPNIDDAIKINGSYWASGATNSYTTCSAIRNSATIIYLKSLNGTTGIKITQACNSGATAGVAIDMAISW